MSKTRTIIPSLLTLLMVLLLVGFFYLTYVFPRNLAIWEEQERALTTLEQTLANLSTVCASFGFFLVPILLFGTFALGIWALIVFINNRQNNGGN